MAVAPIISAPEDARCGRALSIVLLRLTLLLAFVLGVLAALVQLALDVQQQKSAVEESADAFLNSIRPSATTAVYNFHTEAAQQAIEGLFTQRAIRQVTILNGGEVMLDEERALQPTLPAFAPFAKKDEVMLSRDLFAPDSNDGEKIGEIRVVVDRSIVPPAIVRRLASYFVLATVKNLIFGLALVALIYAALARHIVQLAETVAGWRPGSGAILAPRPPRFLVGTEVELLGTRIGQMSGNAETAIQTLEHSSLEVLKNNSKLNKRSTKLSEAVRARTRELNEANRALKRQADCDALTGLMNRRAFDRLAGRAIETARASAAPLAVVMVDIDCFKGFNDHYGHQAGDDCLKRVATALAGLSEDGRNLVARYGGEEFICLLPDCGRQEGSDFATRAHEAIRALAIPHERSSVSDVVTASIGLSWEDNCRDCALETLVGAADEALYEAKHDGRNRTIASSDQIRKRVRKRREIVGDLLAAIESRAFEPFFQSQVDARTGRIVGMEALARWRCPDDTIRGPGEFMQTAEENDLVRLIDAIIFDKCAAFLGEAQAQGVDVPLLSLNLSEEHLKDDALVERLRHLRSSSDTPVAVELLETTALDDPSPKLLWTLDRIRELGFGIEIDDFGTGKTSIVSLMTLRPERLKIARELVMPLTDADLNRRVLRCVLDIGHSLGIDIVAEGVETEEQRRALLELGCHIHQGFHYARPVSAADQLAALSRQQRTRTAS